MDTDKILSVRFAHRHGGKELFDADRFGEGLVQPQLGEVELVRSLCRFLLY
jgi:hypothetical protein